MEHTLQKFTLQELKELHLAFSLMDAQLLATNETIAFAKDVYQRLRELVVSEVGRDDFMEPLGRADFKKFANRERIPRIRTNLRKTNVYAFHYFVNGGMQLDPDPGYMKLMLLDDAIRNSSPDEITYILPFLPYMRQDRIDRPRSPISAKRVIRSITDPDSNIPTRIVTFDLHTPQVQGFARGMVDHLYAEALFIEHVKKNENPEGIVFVSPDAGGTPRVERYAGACETDYTAVQKARTGMNKAKALWLANPKKVRGKKVIVVDDIYDTGGTAYKTGELVMNAGADSIEFYFSHYIASKDDTGPAEDKLRKLGARVVTTDSIPRSEAYKRKNSDILTVLSLAPLVARAIYEIQRPHGSISNLFAYQ